MHADDRRRSGLLLGVVGFALAGSAIATRFALGRQARIARRRIGKPLGEDALDADRTWRPRLEAAPLDLLLLGDSLAAGLGAGAARTRWAARLAKGLARRTRRPVRLRTIATVGSESPDLDAQLAALESGYRPHVAVIVVGGNDVTHGVPVSVSVQHLEDAIRRLQALGAEVVVGTCPDLGALRPVPQPLRSIASRLSRRLAAAQAHAAIALGATAVDLRRAVGPMFFGEPEEMFSLDRFHPSALGYRRTAEALLPAVTAVAVTAVAAAAGSSRRASSRRSALRRAEARGPFGDACRALRLGEVFDPGHHRPAHAERIPDARVPVARHERRRRLAHRRTGRDGARDHGVDIRDVDRHRIAVGISGGRRDEPVFRVRIAQLQRAETEVEIGVRDHAAELGDVDDAGAEDLSVELDRAAGVGDRQERGEGGRRVRAAVGRVPARDAGGAGSLRSCSRR